MPVEAKVVNRYKQTIYATVPPIVEGDPLSHEGDGKGRIAAIEGPLPHD